MTASDLPHWLALYHCLPVASRLHRTLLDVFSGPEEILATSPAVFRRNGVTEKFCLALAEWQAGKGQVMRRVEQDMAWQAQPNQTILTPDSPGFPPLLREIADPPLLLYVAGPSEMLAAPQLAMVGSRKPTASGRRLARRFASRLSQAGLAITSGLAFGIDAESHQGTLDAGGITHAVLGGGLDCLYPRQHQALAERLMERGCLVSEFPLGFHPQPWCFPCRNRLITGLSRGVLVVEATLDSGSLVSASAALEQGREVFAIPGSVDSPQSAGCHRLIREGALLVESAENVLDELGLPVGHGKAGPPGGVRSLPALTPVQRSVLDALEHVVTPQDLLGIRTGLSVGELVGVLGALEVQGLVARESGGYSKLV